MPANSLAPELPRRSPSFVVLICFVTIVFDGYDLVVYGSTIPSILEYQEWGVTPEEAGAIGSYALVGMLIGALSAGALTDIIGRRKIILVSVTWFSLAMGLSALSSSPEMLGIVRFLAGVGLGGVVPTAIALTVEYSPKSRRQLNNALMYSGYFVGGILTALAGLVLLPHVDFRVMYAIGALPLILVVPVAWRYLPESPAFLVAKGRHAEAAALASQYGIDLNENGQSARSAPDEVDRLAGIRTLFSRPYLAATLLFPLASFCGLLLVYGLNTWLPSIMSSAGFELGRSLAFLLVLNAGGIIGTIFASRIADRIGVKPVAVGAFLSAAAAILLLSVNLTLALLLLCVAIAGAGTGSQILVNGYVAVHYPDASRATALGWSLGIGRVGAILGPILGGLVAGSALGFQWNFYMFAAFAAAGAILISAVPRTRASRGRRGDQVGRLERAS
ncbi:MFS transporter [Nocardioides immobilis]|uniref:MFS transporter n=1 Tax=Nocardioides immobilis TaxID=2049295 RepID=A0A417Y749_9ACTN|nr:aromatic acid/H+ symport family MFS transporter [Nocardioides immobilis]RHW28415.1 MFS transporter [Nocardioides immobilis]